VTEPSGGMPAPFPRVAPVLAQLLREIDIGWPRRLKHADGTFGDERHRLRKSDHNPDREGYCRALDITRDVHNGPPLGLLAEYLRAVGASGSQRLAVGGYVIYDRRITSEARQWEWVAYSGDNPHVGHLHVSCSRLPVFYMISRPWGLSRSKLGAFRHLLD